MRAATSMRLLAVLVLAAVLGCGADGGVGGTGISSISGNVALGGVAVIEDPNDLAGILVGLRGTRLRTETDREGFFAIEGEFDGDVTVEFTERDGTVSMLPVDVPARGEVALRNVRFNRGLASAERIEVTFEANIVTDAICDGLRGSLAVADPDSRHTFVVQVDEATAYEGRPGSCPAAPTCEDLAGTRTIKILGVQGQQAIFAERILFVRCRQPRSAR